MHVKIGNRVSGTLLNQKFTGTVTNIHTNYAKYPVEYVVDVRTDWPLTTPSGRKLGLAYFRGSQVDSLTVLPKKGT